MKQIKGYIQIYSRQTRDQIFDAANTFLATIKIGSLSSELFACVDELIKNAVKANYKFLLLRDRMFEKLQAAYQNKSTQEIENDINDIIRIPESYNRFAEDILKHEDISGVVREILNEESKLLTIKNNAYTQKRDLTKEEEESLGKLKKINKIREKIKEKEIKIMLRLQYDGDFLYIEITNTAPILEKDLMRIHEKREEHRRYKNEGREHEFFIDNIDTSESGFGLGYAKIDVILNNWGIYDEMAITIISSINTTVMMTLPVDKIKEKYTE